MLCRKVISSLLVQTTDRSSSIVNACTTDVQWLQFNSLPKYVLWTLKKELKVWITTKPLPLTNISLYRDEQMVYLASKGTGCSQRSFVVDTSTMVCLTTRTASHRRSPARSFPGTDTEPSTADSQQRGDGELPATWTNLAFWASPVCECTKVGWLLCIYTTAVVASRATHTVQQTGEVLSLIAHGAIEI